MTRCPDCHHYLDSHSIHGCLALVEIAVDGAIVEVLI